MDMNNGLALCCDTVSEIFMSDKESLYFLWKCSEEKVINIGGRNIFPEGVTDPFEYLRANGYIDGGAMNFYDVFCADLNECIISGTDKEEQNIEICMKLCPDGDMGVRHLYVRFLKDSGGRVTDMLVYIRAFSGNEEFTRQVISQFTSDKNPAIYTARIMEMMKRHPDEDIAFIQFDIERFKLINSEYGVERGDELLAFINDSMNVICSSEQPFCRLTADVFMVVTPFKERSEITDFIRLIESRIEGFMDMEYRLIFGVCVVDDRSRHTRYFGDKASLSRQSIKGNALENVCFYENDMMNSLSKTQIIEEDMHKAVQNNEFVMYLQPKYCISTGMIIGAEALARWIHPVKGMIPPGEFVPLFEKNGFITRLDRIIWEKACVCLREWLDMGVKPVPISVNVSREYLSGSGGTEALEFLGKLVKKYGVPIDMLELEITESIDAEGVEEMVKKFKESGFTMLMDDFGSGYSSLNMLKTTQFDVLKIDRSFLSEFMESDRGRKIISHTISMSRDIGLDIIAEGVETKDQASFLYDCGCNAAQGFYYSRPVPREEFDRIFLAQNGIVK